MALTDLGGARLPKDPASAGGGRRPRLRTDRYYDTVVPQEAVVQEPDLRSYGRVLWRRKWTVLACTIVAVGGTMAVSLSQTKKYTAKAEVLLQPSNASDPLNSSSSGSSSASQSLTPTDVQTEIQVMTSAPVEQAVAKQFHVPTAPSVSVSPVGQTDVVDLAVTTTSAKRSAAIANGYAHAYIAFKQNIALQAMTAAQQQIQAKISALDNQIASLPNPSSFYSSSTSTAAAAAAASAASAERDSLITQQATFKSQLAQLQVSASLVNGGAALITPASAPASPSSPTPVRNGGLALVVGLILGIGLAFLLDYLDDSVRSQDDLLRVAPDLPTLALVPAVEGWKDPKSSMVVSLARPKSPAAEAYRSLRTSIQFMDLDQPLHRLVITSPAASEGKTTTVANLAVTLAEAGRRVVLVGCDMRRPRIHEFFGLSNDVGFTTVLLGSTSLHAALQMVEHVPNLSLLASGPVPPNPSELLSSAAARTVLDQLSESCDVVLLDTPPVLPVTDAAVLSRHADGVLLVFSAGVTTRKQVGRALEILGQVNAPITGIVLNGLTDQSSYGYSYRYSYGYALSNPSGNGRADKSGKSEPIANRPSIGSGSG